MDEQVYNRYYDTGGNYHWIGVHSGEHIVRKGEKMTRDETIAYGKEQLEIFGGQHQEFIRTAIEALEQYENAFEHGYTEAESKYREILERKRGEWLFGRQIDGAYDVYGIKAGAILCRCSKCNFAHAFIDGHSSQYHYCPNCGADMRERIEDVRLDNEG